MVAVPLRDQGLPGRLFAGLAVLAVTYLLFCNGKAFDAQQLLPGAGAPPNIALQPDPNSYAAMCLIVKDEHYALREWILYHYDLGIRKFYIADDGSQPPMRNLLQDLIDVGLVDYTFLFSEPQPGFDLVMLPVLKNCLQKAEGRHKFVAFLDSDEFIVMRNESETITTLLRDYEQYGALALNWKYFGSSGHVNRPAGGVLQSYTSCVPATNWLSTHIKTVVRPERQLQPLGVHHFQYRKGYFAVNTDFRPVDGPWSKPVAYGRATIHHYATRSIEDLQAKWRRGLPGGMPGRNYTFLTQIEELSTSTCLEAVPLGRRLQEKYGSLLSGPAFQHMA